MSLSSLLLKNASLSEVCDLVVGQKSLFSAFQPIYSFSNQACVGMEALVRGRSLETGFQISVKECLQVPEGLQSREYSYCLNRMHLSHWQQNKPQNSWLFLNLDFQGIACLKDICIGDLLKEMQLDGGEIVIEVVESEIPDEAIFEEIIQSLRAYGCLIALDDFGAGHSNIDRIWKVQPDIVKLDRGVLLEATKSIRSESVLRNLTRLIKESGSVCLIEGIETREQALLALDVGVDLAQGFYFSRPHPSFEQIPQGVAQVVQVVNEYPAYVDEKRFLKQIQRKGYEALYEKESRLHSLGDLEVEMARLLGLTFVKRFFILDEGGFQVSEESQKEVDASVFLKKGKGLCWKNRAYFKHAMKVKEVFVSEPYRSLIDMQLCLTISKKVVLEEGVFVACFDVYYHDKSTESVQISV